MGSSVGASEGLAVMGRRVGTTLGNAVAGCPVGVAVGDMLGGMVGATLDWMAAAIALDLGLMPVRLGGTLMSDGLMPVRLGGTLMSGHISVGSVGANVGAFPQEPRTELKLPLERAILWAVKVHCSTVPTAGALMIALTY